MRRWIGFTGSASGAGPISKVWHIWGDGQPLVLLHGGYGTWAHWVRVVQPLSQRFRLLIPDMPGFGESDGPRQPHSAEGIAAGLAAGIDLITGNSEPLQIAGFSFGGVIAGHLAAQLGDRIRTLVLVAPGGLGAKRGEMPDLIPRSPSMATEEVEAAHRRNLEILMLADPSRVDDLALYLQQRNTALHRVKSGRFPLPTRWRASCAGYRHARWRSGAGRTPRRVRIWISGNKFSARSTLLLIFA